MNYEKSSNIIYQYTADRLKRRRGVLKLTNDVIARKKYLFIMKRIRIMLLMKMNLKDLILKLAL
ncbi:hypothetical protein Q426_10450 [Streptococcus equi subsp. zooepidemicus CY]|nr:hypothetical protein Q426_10450 [Streptococcus equi subsp. zooepidemicus CY]